jgi:hypothetical protein
MVDRTRTRFIGLFDGPDSGAGLLAPASSKASSRRFAGAGTALSPPTT